MGPSIYSRGIHLALVLAALIALPPCNCQMPFFKNKTQVTICTSPYTPMVTCGDESGDPTTFTGYEIEVFKKIYPLLGWDDGNVKFKCMDWTPMLKLLDKKSNGTCDFVAAGVPVTTDDLNKGVQFSWPTYKNGLSIAVRNRQEATSIWAAFSAFSATVWIATIGTAIFIGVLVWLIDHWSRDDTTEEVVKFATAAAAAANKDSEYIVADNTLQDYIITALGRPMQMRDAHAKSLASNIVLLGFSFACLVLVALYTASTAANITTTQLQSNIHSLNDLPGKVVGTFSDYTDQLKKYGISAVPFSWDNDEDEQSMFDALTNGTIQALVLDSSVLQFRAANNCEISIVGEPFESFDQAISFPKGFENLDLQKAINEGLVKLQEDGTLDALEEKYIQPPEANCKTGGVSDSSQQITFTQVAGLWIIIACTVAVALVVLIVHKLHVRYTRKKLRELKTKFFLKAKNLSSKRRSIEPSVYAIANEVMQNHT